MKSFWVPIICMMVGSVSSRAEERVDVTARFDHDAHLDRVIKARGLSCDHCHNFKVDLKAKTAVLLSGMANSALNRPLKAICHECHQSAEAKNKAAPQECYNCHRSEGNLQDIKPRNHLNIGWAQSHATNARIDGDACMNCHTTSQCVKCHQRRNDVEFKNHSRNFRFYHSVVARAQPQKCDTCHSRVFCTDCHSGKK
ncbi:cytochrome c3 family protein [Bdellovibrionota bacterium FG-2]